MALKPPSPHARRFRRAWCRIRGHRWARASWSYWILRRALPWSHREEPAGRLCLRCYATDLDPIYVHPVGDEPLHIDSISLVTPGTFRVVR